MPNQSQHFINLVSAFNTLTATYLPNKDPIGIPDPKEQELARAFIVLIHAEMEFYFESICEEIILAAQNEFKSGQANLAALGLITFSGLPPLTGGELLIPGKKGFVRKLSERFWLGVDAHNKIISGNNGIRQKYLAPLFAPLGLTKENIDVNWVVLMDQFADKRGAIAHKSMFHIEAGFKNINPQDEEKLVRRLIFDNPHLKSPGVISSIEGFDNWAMAQGRITTFRQNNSRHSSLLKRLLWCLVGFIDRWEHRLSSR